MSAIDRILLLMKERGISGTALTSALKISSSSITEWKKGKANPSYGALVKIASFFNVPIEYLEGKTDEPTIEEPTPPNVTPDEFAILKKLRALPEAKKKALIELLG